MENEIACEDFYIDEEQEIVNLINNSEYTDDELFTFSDGYDPLYKKYQKDK